jgi:act minimal PKS acyl carrier protein
MMHRFTVDDLREIMRRCAGTSEGVDLEGDILDIDYDDLGYDSLALLEIQSQIGLQFGASLGDDALAELRTPRRTVDAVNQLLGSGV